MEQNKILNIVKDKKPNIFVIGDFIIDHYLWGTCERISPEAPVQIIDMQKEEYLLGGAGNVINNLLALGANVGFCSVSGDDKNSLILKKMLQEKGLNLDGLMIQENRKTTKKSRIMALHQQIVRVDQEDSSDITESMQKKLFQYIDQIISNYDIVLLSDYNKGVLTPWLCEMIIEKALKHNKKILVDPKGKDYTKYKGATLITPNKKEASLATGIGITGDKSLYTVGLNLKKNLGLEYLLITLSEDGMALFDKKMTKIPTKAKEVYDVTGAGDTVLASLAFALSIGMDIFKAANFANSAAAVAVGKIGTATVTIDEIFNYEQNSAPKYSNLKIKNIDELKKYLNNNNNKKIVFTNGCFDILHSGHVKYLEEAKSYGDILIVGLNSDSSVKNIKGPSRPINNASDRAIILAGLSCVDIVVEFEEDTPYNLIKTVKPDILVKGGDYKDKTVVGSDIAKETRLVKFVDGKSTTKIIQKAKSS